MRILLDESVPGRFGALLVGDESITVQKRGWAGLKNGRRLAIASEHFDVLPSADRGIQHQQDLAALPIAVVILVATGNRIEDMTPLAGPVLEARATLAPRRLLVIQR